MSTDVYFRNPDNYIRECVEVNARLIAWDRGYLVKKRIEPNRFADLHYPASIEYTMLAIGDQGTAHLDRTHSLAAPLAVYPTWEYGEDDMELLLELLANPVGLDQKACEDKRRPADERPVFGQKHMVVIIRPPDAGHGVGRKFFRLLSELQDEFPDAQIHVHGLYSYRVLFGLNFTSVDIDPRSHAAKGKVVLGNGRQATYEVAQSTPQWVTVLGMNPAELKVARNRCMFNIKSAWWAAGNYRENTAFRVAGKHYVDPDAHTAVPATVASSKSSSTAATVGDKFLCDSCSIRDSCKYFRSEGVCSIPGSETAPLIKLFKSRDAEDIMNGLGEVMARQVGRLESGMASEDFMSELDPEVTKIAALLLTQGVKLAKLRSPELASAGATRINLGFINGAPVSPNAMAAQMVAQLEADGYTRDQITPELMQEKFGQPKVLVAIETTAVEATSVER